MTPIHQLALHGVALGATVLASLALGPAAARAQIQHNPTGVNVAASGPTTVFITYGNLDGYTPVEALWCGDLVNASPDLGQRCAPGTLYGQLPIRYDLGRASGQDGFTDIMSIPTSVSRRAYQAARRGENAAFFYVRRFVDTVGGRPDQFIPVTCRLSGGGARVPFAILDIGMSFATEAPVLSVAQGETAPPLTATIHYNGTGRLVGRWEIVLPGDEPPSSRDLLTEATLPVELRGTQRRYTEIARFNVFLPPTGRVVLEGPDPEALPTHMKGLHQILLRIEASDDREGDSSLESAGAGLGTVHTGGVAGFPIPPLRYYVGGAAEPAAPLTPVEPTEGAALPPAEPVRFSWVPLPGAFLYRVEVQDAEGEEVLVALRQPAVAAYQAPVWLSDRLPDGVLSWRVLGLDADGRTTAASEWRSARFETGSP